MDIVTTLILSICYHGLTFHLNMSSYMSFYLFFIISFSWRNIALQFCFRFLPYNSVNQPCCCCCLITKPCPTLLWPMDCKPSGSSVLGISQKKILEWVGISFSRGSSWPRDGGPYLLHWRPDSLTLSYQGNLWISHDYTYIPSLLNLFPTLSPSYSSRLSQSTRLSFLCYTATSCCCC